MFACVQERCDSEECTKDANLKSLEFTNYLPHTLSPTDLHLANAKFINTIPVLHGVLMTGYILLKTFLIKMQYLHEFYEV